MSSLYEPGASDHTMKREYGSKTDAILCLSNRANGSPAAIAIIGAVKCIICGEVTSDRAVCQLCSLFVRNGRPDSMHDRSISERVLKLFETRPHLLEMLEHMTDEMVAEYYIERIKQSSAKSDS